jgi:hypothetical protein
LLPSTAGIGSSVSRKKLANKLPPFIPLFRETVQSEAWRQLSFGARLLFLALVAQHHNNNGHVYRSLREVAKDLGHKDRSDIANWFRELVHYGFIVQTSAASLGVEGKGKAPHWRITDRPVRNGRGELDTATKDFLRWNGELFEPHVRPSRRWNAGKMAALKKQNPGRHVRTTVDGTFVPEVVGTFVPTHGESGTDVTPISEPVGGTDVTPITRLTTWVARPGSPERKGK